MRFLSKLTEKISSSLEDKASRIRDSFMSLFERQETVSQPRKSVAISVEDISGPVTERPSKQEIRGRQSRVLFDSSIPPAANDIVTPVEIPKTPPVPAEVSDLPHLSDEDSGVRQSPMVTVRNNTGPFQDLTKTVDPETGLTLATLEKFPQFAAELRAIKAEQAAATRNNVHQITRPASYIRELRPQTQVEVA